MARNGKYTPFDSSAASDQEEQQLLACLLARAYGCYINITMKVLQNICCCFWWHPREVGRRRRSVLRLNWAIWLHFCRRGGDIQPREWCVNEFKFMHTVELQFLCICKMCRFTVFGLPRETQQNRCKNNATDELSNTVPLRLTLMLSREVTRIIDGWIGKSCRQNPTESICCFLANH